MKKILGIELGSTRIKSVLINEKGVVLAQGSHEWENQLENGYWTYSLDAVISGLQDSYASLVKNYGEITELDGIGISAMMHGYLAFDKDDNLLVPFRTWRNTTTAVSAEILTRELDFNMPQRWSTSHYYQAVIDNEAHVPSVAFLTTLAGYVHYLLTGKKVLGIGDASGMFPVKDNTYNADMLKDFNELIRLEYDGYSKGWSLLEDTGSYYDGYKSFDSWSYNYLTNQFNNDFTGGGKYWYAASKGTISYYLDPKRRFSR